jgi:hypothetical protein
MCDRARAPVDLTPAACRDMGTAVRAYRLPTDPPSIAFKCAESGGRAAGWIAGPFLWPIMTFAGARWRFDGWLTDTSVLDRSKEMFLPAKGPGPVN